MREKLAKAGEGGWRTHTPFHYIYHHVQSCGVRSIRKGRYNSPFSIPPLYVLCGWYFGQIRHAEYVDEIYPSDWKRLTANSKSRNSPETVYKEFDFWFRT
jgi:hypothetical protein